MAEQEQGADRPRDPLDEKTWKELVACLSTIKHGSVTLVIQNSQIIQIEKNEKLRLV
ncbi:MAG: YezD family protein [Treponema sp.]|jgi:hypothetical protein|nr:YezD family protein [Treponema sp.]